MGQRHCGRRAGIPFVLAAGVEIDIRLTAHDRHGLCPGRAHTDQFSAQLFRHGHGFGGRPRAADQHPQLFRSRRNRTRTIGAQHEAKARQRNRANGRHAINRQRHMHGPVGAFFAIFAGAVHRIDDPDARLCETFCAVLFLFGQEAVFRPLFAQGMDKKLVGRGIARLAQRLGGKHPGGAHLDQQPSGNFCQMRGEFGVSHVLLSLDLA